MQMKGKAQSSAFTPSLPLPGNSKSIATSTKPVKFNTPNSSGSQSARMDSSTQPSTQDAKAKRGTRVQTDVVREAQQIPFKTKIDMKEKDEKRKFKYRQNRDYGATNTSGSSSFSYDTPEMFTESASRRPNNEIYEAKKVTRVSRDVSVNLSTVGLTPGFPTDVNPDKQKLKTDSVMWRNFKEVFNEIRS